ncbi:MAG: 6-phosphogluconate dehydrogenase (decarboxylating), partial [Conexibacteraceae bacterium]|nr:6-phosphogluconate dehydrogenase (decarboxylating) [Conexibacteraceae bacterium]
GLMAAYAEGLNVLFHANIGKTAQEEDAETAPIQDAAKYYAYDFDMPAIAEVWRRGSVVASWLLDLTAEALVESTQLNEFTGRVSDSGEGRWTVAAAVDESVPANVLSASLFSRFSSRGEADYGDKLLSAMRKQFGGHAEKASAGV